MFVPYRVNTLTCRLPWANLGAMVAGFFIGLLLLKMQRIYLADCDNPTALDHFSSKAP